MPRGLGTLDAFEEQRGRAKEDGEYILHLRLRDDKESARVRFLTESEDVYWEWFHTQRETTSRGKTIWVDRVCPRQIGQECAACASEDFPSRQFLAWVWVYHVDHAQPGPDRRPVTVGTLVRHRETVGGVRLLRASAAHAGALSLAVARYGAGALTSRDYEWVRAGAAGASRPTYSLLPADGDATPLPPAAAAAAGALPDLEDVAFRRVTKLPAGLRGGGYRVVAVGAPAAPPPATAEGSGAGPDGPPPDELPLDELPF